MNTEESLEEDFELLHADDFDARRGFTRWVVPGTIAVLPGHPYAHADLWTDRDGRLFVRFSSAGYVFHYEIVSSAHCPITEDMKESVEGFLQWKLVTWVTEAIDDSVLNM